MTVVNLDILAHARFIDLVTYRRDGTPVGTQVLFVEKSDRLLVRVAHNCGKVKRLRHDSRVEVAACDQRGRRTGPAYIGQARVLGHEDVEPTLRLLHAKYPMSGRLFSMIRMVQGRRNVIVEVTLDA
jgi:PPOX class probable F420-dependent enzyme